MDWGAGITTLGTTTLREKKVSFGLKDSDRTKHFAVLGKADSGRGNLLVNMALQDIARGVGVLYLDATGTSATKLLERVDQTALERVIFLDPSDAEYPFSWNPVDDFRSLPKERQVGALAELLSEVYQLPPSPFLEQTAELMLRERGVSLVTFHSLVTDTKFRNTFFAPHPEDQSVFEDELSELPELAAALADYGKYIAKDTLVRNLLGQHESKFLLASLAEGRIVIVDFSRIRMYPTRMTPLIRALLIAGCAAANERTVAVYLHDALRYVSESGIPRLLAPANNCAVTIADTIIQEADIDRRVLAMSRVGSVASFVAHPADSVVLDRTFAPHVSMEDLLDLPPNEFIAALAIDGVRSKPFFAHALDLPKKKHAAYQDLVVDSRRKYATVRTRLNFGFTHRHDDADLDDDEDMDEGDGDGGQGEQRNFQDAFRNIFAKQAERAQAAIKPTTPPPPSPETPQAPEHVETKTEPSVATPKTNELDEDALKKMLFVAPVALALFLTPLHAFASVTITEIMYDVSGTDSGREWVEIHNTSNDTFDLSEWKFFEGNTNHGLTLVSGGAFAPGGYAVIADSPEKFLADWPGFSGVVYDSSFSLSNTGELLAVRNPELIDVDSVMYENTLGAAGDGNTLQKVGTTWLSAPASPGSANGPSTSPPPPSAAPSSAPNSSPSATPSEESKKISANAGPDRTVVAGADVVFDGKATGFIGDPLPSAQYTWSFGNGDYREGRSVLYSFVYPGTYVVVLDVASGEHGASDRAIVTAVPAALTITSVTSEYISLKNDSKSEVDLAQWLLVSGGKKFQFPDNTIMLAGHEVSVAHSRSGLEGGSPETVALQYPNGEVAVTYTEPVFSSIPVIQVVPEKKASQASPASPPPHFEPVTAQPSELVATAAIAPLENSSPASTPLVAWLGLVCVFALVVGVGVIAVLRKSRSETGYTITEMH